MHAFIGWAFLATATAVPPLDAVFEPPIVAIDAGHGGDYVGAVGVCGLREKDLTLAIATRLQRALTKSGAATPLMVRRTDSNPSLTQRAERANAAHAVLLISIHANASPSRGPRGVETFFLSNHAASGRVARLAARENDDDPVYTTLDGSDAALQKVLAGLTLDAAHNESQALAMQVQSVLGSRVNSRARGVMQAPLHILRAAHMAAVLVEVGFLTNSRECERLQKAWHQQTIAEALATAIVTHLQNNPLNDPPQWVAASQDQPSLDKNATAAQ
jgi:N-acetylmuramoyl-L-alanine amidase